MDEFLPGVMVAAATAKPIEVASPPEAPAKKGGGARGAGKAALASTAPLPPPPEQRPPGLPLPPGMMPGGQHSVGITRKILRKGSRVLQVFKGISNPYCQTSLSTTSNHNLNCHRCSREWSGHLLRSTTRSLNCAWSSTETRKSSTSGQR